MGHSIKNGFRVSSALAGAWLGPVLLLSSCGGDGGGAAAPQSQAPSFAAPPEQRLSVAGGAVSIPIENAGGGVAGCSVSSSSAAALPAGLRVERMTVGGKETCAIVGTVAPTATLGLVEVMIEATSASGRASTVVSFVVERPQPPSFAMVPEQRLPAAGGAVSIPLDNGGGDVTGCAVSSSSSAALPDGLRVERATVGGKETCAIVGVLGSSAAAGVFGVTIEATSAAGAVSVVVPLAVEGRAGVPSFTMVPERRLSVTGDSVVIALENVGGDASGCGIPGSSPSGLPDGLRVEGRRVGGKASCAIVGILASSATAGLVEVEIVGSNSVGRASVLVSIVVEGTPPPPPPPPIAVPILSDIATLQELIVGKAVTGIVFGNSGGAAASCEVAPGSDRMPAGLSFDVVMAAGGQASCALVGVPANRVVVARDLRVRARNAGGVDDGEVSVRVDTDKPLLRDFRNGNAQSLTVDVALGSPLVFVNDGAGGLLADDAVPTPGCVSIPALQAGLRLSRTSDGGSCQIAGTPSRVAARSVHMVTATNGVGSDAAMVVIVVTPAGVLSTALDTDLDVRQAGDGGWTAQTTETNDGVDAASAGNGTGEGDGSCVEADIMLPGRYSFYWRSVAGASRFRLEAGGRSLALPATGEWERLEGELPAGAQRASSLKWCHRGGEGEAHLDQVSYIGAVTGLAAASASSTVVNLRWDEYPGAGYYVVSQGDSADVAQASAITSGQTQTGRGLEVSGLSAGSRYHFWVRACDADGCGAHSLPASVVPRKADGDSDGLIDIHDQMDLHSVRNAMSGGALQHSRVLAGNTEGCPRTGCNGYELVADIDFDADGDGSTWTANADGTYSLDPGDNHRVYFDVGAGGWEPIGGCNSSCALGTDNVPFGLVFDGGGYVISGLAAWRRDVSVGMFGLLGAGASLRRVALEGNLAGFSGAWNIEVFVGGLAGYMADGIVSGSYTTGPAVARAGDDNRVGGLIARVDAGSIVASFASGDVRSGAGALDIVGGLVGTLRGGSIVASYAAGRVVGGNGSSDSVGGLVGRQGADVTACYASGDVSGGSGDGDEVGGLAGIKVAGILRASYATGGVDGLAGGNDRVGGLIGRDLGGLFFDSWGFGDVTGGNQDSGTAGGKGDPPAALAESLLAPDSGLQGSVPVSWDSYGLYTGGAWDFGGADHLPALRYADYDGNGHAVHCENAPGRAVSGAVVVPHCGELLPGQRALEAPTLAGVAPTGDGELTLRWQARAGAKSYRVYRSGSASRTDAVEVSAPGGQAQTHFVDSGLDAGNVYRYWVRACGLMCSADSALAMATATDFSAPDIRAVGLPGQALPTYRYVIGERHMAKRLIRFVNTGAAMTSCTVADSELPAGMSVDAASCAISGVPTRLTSETTMHTVSAGNGSGTDAVVIGIETFHLEPPDIRVPWGGATLALASGQSSGFPIVFGNVGGSPDDCAFQSSMVASSVASAHGLVVSRSADNRSCQLALERTAVEGEAAQGVTYYLQASNSVGASAFAVTLSVAASTAASPGSLSVVGGSSDFAFAMNAPITPITFAHTGVGLCSIAPKESSGEALPAGLAIDPVSCTISGTPRAALGETAYTVRYARGSVAEELEISLTVTDGALVPLNRYTPALFYASSKGLPALLPVSGGAPTACAATVAEYAPWQGDLADYNLSITPDAAGCVLDSLDGQGPLASAINASYTLYYQLIVSNAAGVSQPSFLSPVIGEPRPIGVAAGGSGDFTCAIGALGRLHCWGASGSFLGAGDVGDYAAGAPAQLGSDDGWRSLTAGDSHVCALRGAEGALYCWGEGANGRLGLGSAASSSKPARLGLHEGAARGLAAGWIAVDAGGASTCAIKGNGQLYCWGAAGPHLGLEEASAQDSLAPALIGAYEDAPRNFGHGWTHISVGAAHACAIRDQNGLLFCWGTGTDGQVGRNNTDSFDVPRRVGMHEGAKGIDTGWTAVSAGHNHTCAIQANRFLYCWGEGSKGQLGLGNTDDALAPAIVGDLSSWSSISAGNEYSCATTSAGALYCWGSNTEGQIGIDTTTPATVSAPTQVGARQPYAYGWTSVSASADEHTCAVRRMSGADQLWCWGEGSDGEIGQGAGVSSAAPVQVDLPSR